MMNKEIFRFLSSVRLALVLLTLITLVSFIGTFIPGIYQSWWFILILSFFGLNLLLCNLGRLKLSKKRWGSAITHFSVLVILVGAMISTLWAVRGAIELYEGETKGIFITNRGPRQLDFKIFLDDFYLEWYKPSFYRLTVYVRDKGIKQRYQAQSGKEYKIKGTDYSFRILNYLPDFFLENNGVAINKSEQPDNPAVLVSIDSQGAREERWVFAKHPHFSNARDSNIEFFYDWDGTIKEFRSSIRLIDKGKVVLAKDIRVNAPVKYKGYTFYQTGYDSKRLNWTALEVVKDPGVFVVFLGFLLLNAGVILNFYFKLK